MKKGTVAKRLLALAVATAMLFAAGMVFANGTSEKSSSGSTSGSNASSADSLSSVDPSGQSVTFWHNHSQDREKGLAAMIDAFNSSNQWKITVKEEYVGNYDDIYNKMITALAGGQVPGLVVAYQNQAAAYQLAHGLVDLNPYVNSAKWGISDKSDFFEGWLNQDLNPQFNNQRLGWPVYRSAEVLYYDKTWLNQLGQSAPPTTWDQFASDAKAAVDKAKGYYGYAISTDASNIFAQIAGRGGSITKPDGSGYTFNTPEAKAVFTFLKNLYDSGAAKKIAEQYGDQTDFGNHKTLFTMGSTSGIPFYAQAVSKGAAGSFDWTVAAMPHTTTKPVVDIYGASISVTRTTPEKQLASWLFLKWFSDPPQEAQWVRISNYFPTRKSTASSLTDYFQKNPVFKDAFDALSSSVGVYEPPFNEYQKVREMVTSAINAVLDGADIDKTLAQLEADANKAHKESAP